MTATTSSEAQFPRPSDVVPQGELIFLSVDEIKESRNNPRRLFDPAPLSTLKENIRQNGVLVPITVFRLKGQGKYQILDGARRYRCCKELKAQGNDVRIPANVVNPPNHVSGVLYMFSIHNYREQWELMPMALSLKEIMEKLNEKETSALRELTGASEMQIERCKTLLTFPEEFQNLSLDPDPKKRIPANFWIEAAPFLDLCANVLPEIYASKTRDGITRTLVEKYRSKSIKSVIHFRKIIEAYGITPEERQSEVVDEIRRFLFDIKLETRTAFDKYVIDTQRIRTAIQACDDFRSQIDKAKLDHVVDRDQLMESLSGVVDYIKELLQKLEGSDPPDPSDSPELLSDEVDK